MILTRKVVKNLYKSEKNRIFARNFACDTKK